MFHTTAAIGRFIWSDVVEGFRMSFIRFHQIMPHQQKVRPAGDIWQQHPQMRRYAFGRWVGKLYWKVAILWCCRETLYKSYWYSAGMKQNDKMWCDYYVNIYLDKECTAWIYLTQPGLFWNCVFPWPKFGRWLQVAQFEASSLVAWLSRRLTRSQQHKTSLSSHV